MSSLIKKDAFGTSGKEPFRFLELSFDEYVEGNIAPVYFRVCDQTTLNWNGFNWIHMPWEIKGEGRGSDAELARPKLTLPNKKRQFSWYAERGFLEGATVSIYEVHPDELNTTQSHFRSYILARTVSDNEVQISFELRYPSDGPNFKLPRRRFIAPEFQSVKR